MYKYLITVDVSLCIVSIERQRRIDRRNVGKKDSVQMWREQVNPLVTI